MLAKLFVASVRCPICQQANDFDFHFYQRCGYNRKILKAPIIQDVSVDLDAIAVCVQQNLHYEKATSYVSRNTHYRRGSTSFHILCRYDRPITNGLIWNHSHYKL